MKIRKHIKFYGRVQGVGFRYKSYHLADALGLTGYVQNEYDGTVEMEVQGEEIVIADFLDRLKDDRYIAIEHMDQWKLDCVEECGFSMRN